MTFDTGLLSREGDVPLAVSEGLATLGETWTTRRTDIGLENHARIEVMKQPGDGPDWIPIDELFASDGFFNDGITEQLAYAESWLMMYWLLRTREDTAKLRGYLADLRARARS